jgi:hypothetical protein
MELPVLVFKSSSLIQMSPLLRIRDARGCNGKPTVVTEDFFVRR